MAWSDVCRGCEAIEQERSNRDTKHIKGLRVFLRCSWAITKAELRRLGG